MNVDKRSLDRLYGSYASWKSWTSEVGSSTDGRVFAKELRRAGAKPPSRILEIGFGAGQFLNWGRQNGFDMVGIDIVASHVESARAKGHVVHCGDLTETNPFRDDEFDLIVLFDVLEHMVLEQIVALFTEFDRILKPKGRVVARFPNGASPFSGYYQHGDATHRSVLTSGSVDQIAALCGFRVCATHNAAWGIQSPRLRVASALVPLISAGRYCVQSFIGWLFLGRNVPMDPNITVIVDRARDEI
ncbi:MAG TPA: class I SAM-dependent methyltransferase [Gammaproteobacteria bacterium]|nr:class I SAM-dependent methyltransferase [Gammaproteobacteria bacterium]